MIYEQKKGMPRFICEEYMPKSNDYAVLIPVLNEGKRIWRELKRACIYGIYEYADIIICDGDSTDGCIQRKIFSRFRVNSLLIKKDEGKQGTQLRMGMWWALERGYKGIITIDGNNKDSIEDVPKIIEKLAEGYDLVQGSRFIPGGRAVHTPFFRLVSVRMVHAPIISISAGKHFTDTTNAFRGYSARYLLDERVQPFRDIFVSYELLAYLSVRATQIGYRACEVPVTRAYPATGAVPTKIRFLKGNSELFIILLKNLFRAYHPKIKDSDRCSVERNK